MNSGGGSDCLIVTLSCRNVSQLLSQVISPRYLFTFPEEKVLNRNVAEERSLPGSKDNAVRIEPVPWMFPALQG